VAATVLLWGSAFVGIRATLPALGYANLASGRLLLAAATFAMLSRRIGVRRPTKSQLPLLAALGATGYQLVLSAGEQTVSAGTSALLFSGAPVVLAAVALYALWVVLQKRALATMSAVDVTAWATWLGAGFALPFASGLPHAVTTAPAGALASLLLLGIIVTTVPFLLWTWALARVEATSAAPFLLLVSPAALLIAWLWLGEAPALAAVAGGALTLVGVATVQIGSRTPPSTARR